MGTGFAVVSLYGGMKVGIGQPLHFEQLRFVLLRFRAACYSGVGVF